MADLRPDKSAFDYGIRIKPDGTKIIFDHGKITTIPPKKDCEETEKKVLTEEEWEKLLEKEAEEATKKLFGDVVPVHHD